MENLRYMYCRICGVKMKRSDLKDHEGLCLQKQSQEIWDFRGVTDKNSDLCESKGAQSSKIYGQCMKCKAIIIGDKSTFVETNPSTKPSQPLSCCCCGKIVTITDAVKEVRCYHCIGSSAAKQQSDRSKDGKDTTEKSRTVDYIPQRNVVVQRVEEVRGNIPEINAHRNGSSKSRDKIIFSNPYPLMLKDPRRVDPRTVRNINASKDPVTSKFPRTSRDQGTYMSPEPTLKQPTTSKYPRTSRDQGTSMSPESTLKEPVTLKYQKISIDQGTSMSPEFPRNQCLFKDSCSSMNQGTSIHQGTSMQPQLPISTPIYRDAGTTVDLNISRDQGMFIRPVLFIDSRTFRDSLTSTHPCTITDQETSTYNLTSVTDSCPKGMPFSEIDPRVFTDEGASTLYTCSNSQLHDKFSDAQTQIDASHTDLTGSVDRSHGNNNWSTGKISTCSVPKPLVRSLSIELPLPRKNSDNLQTCDDCARRFSPEKIQDHINDCHSQTSSKSNIESKTSHSHCLQEPKKVTVGLSNHFKICYICGGMYGTMSISIHERQCLDKWRVQNDQLPSHLQQPGLHRPESIPAGQQEDTVRSEESGTVPKTASDIDSENDAAWKCHLKNLIKCLYCNRTFAPDRIVKHEAVCLALFAKRLADNKRSLPILPPKLNKLSVQHKYKYRHSV